MAKDLSETLIEPSPEAIPIIPLPSTGLEGWLTDRPSTVRRWIAETGFTAEAGQHCLVPADSGAVDCVLLGVPAEPDLWCGAGLPEALPDARYVLDAASGTGPVDPAAFALGWVLGTYAFTRYKATSKTYARLAWPDGVDRAALERAARAVTLVRDLVNTPAGDMGPSALAAAAEALATSHGARASVTVGDALLEANYPAIHAVGRASEDAPRLIDIVWGDDSAPRITLVGKGVCFDTGGLDIKPAAAMKLMKKDMGGAAHALGLAHMIMDAGLPVRLRVLIPAVENSIAGNALYPLDVVPTRKGKTIEIGHTDAEGRVVLADALAEADGEAPALLVDYATLTGAARVALGPDLPALFCNDDDLAADILECGRAAADPVWRMPLWEPYRKLIEGKVADITNSTDSPYAGSITAALFLSEFVSHETPWAHFDVMAWNTAARPGRPEGGEAMAMRALFDVVAARYG